MVLVGCCGYECAILSNGDVPKCDFLLWHVYTYLGMCS